MYLILIVLNHQYSKHFICNRESADWPRYHRKKRLHLLIYATTTTNTTPHLNFFQNNLLIISPSFSLQPFSCISLSGFAWGDLIVIISQARADKHARTPSSQRQIKKIHLTQICAATHRQKLHAYSFKMLEKIRNDSMFIIKCLPF